MKTLFWVNALGEFGREVAGELTYLESDTNIAHLSEKEWAVLRRHEQLAFTLEMDDGQFRFYGSIRNGKEPSLIMSIEFMYYIDQYEVEELVAQLAGEYGAAEIDPFWDAPDNFEQGWYFDRTTGEHTKTADPKETYYRRQVGLYFEVWGWSDEEVIALRDAMRNRVETIGLSRDWVSVC